MPIMASLLTITTLPGFREIRGLAFLLRALPMHNCALLAPRSALHTGAAALPLPRAPPSRTFVVRTTGPRRFVGSFLGSLAQLDPGNAQHRCRPSCPPPRPYFDRHTRQPFDPDLLSDACYVRMRELLRAVQPLADDFDALSTAEAVTFLLGVGSGLATSLVTSPRSRDLVDAMLPPVPLAPL